MRIMYPIHHDLQTERCLLRGPISCLVPIVIATDFDSF